ncbi:MAG: divalent-cation tolerance protein CutA [Bdellovibrionales bacterium]|nr:divalent-cation tolerance protein CutA [Bdellovibrionales bacterium]
MSDGVFVYVTFATASEAERIGRSAIEADLAACVNVLPAHHSLYRWDGGIESASEHIALFKTVKASEDALRAWIEKNHSYDCPCIASIDITKLNSDFAAWLQPKPAF